MLEQQRGELLESIARDLTTLRDLEDKSLSLLQKSEGKIVSTGLHLFSCILGNTLNLKWKNNYLKTLDTTGNCHRPVFSLGVSQHMHTTTKL